MPPLTLHFKLSSKQSSTTVEYKAIKCVPYACAVGSSLDFEILKVTINTLCFFGDTCQISGYVDWWTRNYTIYN